MSFPVVYHDRYRDYNFGPEHPFSPVRLEMLTDLLDALDVADYTPPEVAAREDVLRVHDETFVEVVETASDGLPPLRAKQHGLDTADVPVFPDMDEATRGLVGGTLHAAQLVADGSARRVLQLGGGLHHAQRALASGFCVYNDLSVAIDYLREQDLRVAYIDIDVHHGDGVQWIHYDDPEVMTISLHESGRYLFPGTGSADELGDEPAKGTSINVPLEPNTENESYLEVFDRVVPYALKQFEPDVLVVQCGADAHRSDPLADLMLTTHAYKSLFDQLLELADTYTDGRAVFTLGGGYRFDATVRIWALLYLVVTGRSIPVDLPEDWCERWSDRQNERVSSRFHDTKRDSTVQRCATITEQNRRVSKRVLELAAPHWY